jgi:hypothetical protein
MHRPAAICLLALWIGGGCGGTGGARPAVLIDAQSARYRLQQDRLAARGRPVRVIWTYRHLVAPLLASRCRMFPGDSEYYVHQRRSCGTFTTLLRAVSRIFLEVGASADVLPLTMDRGHLQFVDLPETSAPCGR